MSLILHGFSNLALLNCILCKDILFHFFPRWIFFVGGVYSVITSFQHYLCLYNKMS